jgi:hypothetical protein
MGFWGENWRVHERKPKNRVAYSGAARMASSWRAQGELPSSAPMFLVVKGTRGRSRLFQTDSFDVFDCSIAFLDGIHEL